MATNPYPGLRPFRAEQARLFMGRELVSDVALTRVRISPVTVMFARSGVGKSSFLTCRLMPLLEKDSNVEYINEWGSQPSHELVEKGIHSLLGRTEKQEKPVLILDQFEDVFKFPSQRELLWDLLASHVNIDEPLISLLISMREEWLGAWGEATNYIPDGRISLFRLFPLNDREVMKAIRRPAEIEGTVTVTQGLVDMLTKDLKRPNAFGMGDFYVEPGLLQLVCSKLWENAAATKEKLMDAQLYQQLGQADTIIRHYVWDSLDTASLEPSHFSSSDRILWVGLTRHVILAQGVKAIVDPISLAKKLKIEDLGVAGEATAISVPSIEGNTYNALSYLKARPEKRSEPPLELTNWISSVLLKAVNAGFLKQQKAVKAARDQSGILLYELSHDFLATIFQQFAVEFEGWLRTKIAKLVGLLIGLLVILPFAIVVFVNNNYDLLRTLRDLLFYGGFLLIEGVVMVISFYIFKFMARILIHPITRLLAKGQVPFPENSNTHGH